jgi:hypothetical protein
MPQISLDEFFRVDITTNSSGGLVFRPFPPLITTKSGVSRGIRDRYFFVGIIHARRDIEARVGIY